MTTQNSLPAGGQPSPGGIVYPLGPNKRFLLIPIQLPPSPGFAWRTESIPRGMFPLGESGAILAPIMTYDEHFFSMSKDENDNPILYDLFEMREFPLFD
ncbi:MAG: hypothetical protein GY847_18605 [Proteobacteria bacterium]|nr:hypothetical protein [Pseudomonadota bacterium]